MMDYLLQILSILFIKLVIILCIFYLFSKLILFISHVKALHVLVLFSIIDIATRFRIYHCSLILEWEKINSYIHDYQILLFWNSCLDNCGRNYTISTIYFFIMWGMLATCLFLWCYNFLILPSEKERILFYRVLFVMYYWDNRLHYTLTVLFSSLRIITLIFSNYVSLLIKSNESLYMTAKLIPVGHILNLVVIFWY